MTRITFIEHNGKQHEVNVSDGSSLMQAAVDNMVPGILADCGGFCCCATCRCEVDESFVAALPAMADAERDILEGLDAAVPNMRLSCQIPVCPELDGLVVRLPASQF